MIRTARNITGNLTERCQVCVIGSGAGGAVVAAELAEAGYDVLILEEGGYHRTTTFSHDPLRMLPKLYRNAGGDSTLGNPPILFTEGRCVGGSTVINAGICYRTPEKVLRVWSLALGTQQLLPAAMDDYFNQVEQNLHVTVVPDEIIGEDGKRMRLAAERLGYHYSRVKRNIYACQGSNQCIVGCPTGAKQSTLITYLPRARQNGARIIANCRAQRLLLDGDHIKGVFGQILEPISGKVLHHVNISAETVFLAAGALQTPALLYRSEIAKRVKSVGRTLFMHPNAKCIGVFEDKIHGWQGSIQGFQIDEFTDTGYTFGSTFLPPGILALSLPLYGDAMRRFMANYNRMSVWGVLVEDVHPGRLRFTRNGQPIAFYRVTAEDRARFKEGIAKLCEIFLAAGAHKIHLPLHGANCIRSQDDIRTFRQQKSRAGQFHLFTVHLMGTCRMGADPNNSVVGVDHRVHGLQNLYISDASVFPSPIRVNPMITIMAMATRAADVFRESKRFVRKAA